MSLLDGLSEELENPMFNALMESNTNFHEEFSEAIEASVDRELSEADIAAILDDNNPDNQMADLGAGEEYSSDAGASNDPSLEAMIRQYRDLEAEMAEEALIRECEEILAACESDENPLPPMDPSIELDDGSELAGVNEEEEETEEGVSLESLLANIF